MTTAAFDSDRPPCFGWSVGYPLAAERLGPAWREAWRTLAEHPSTWHRGAVLATVIAPHYDLTRPAVSNLLADAARYGVLERRYVREGRSRVRYAEYRPSPSP